MSLRMSLSVKKMLNEGVMNFFFKKEEGRSLSNFWECVVKIEDGEARRSIVCRFVCMCVHKVCRTSNV